MKDIYKQKVTDNIDSSIYKIKVVHQMVIGDRPADATLASSYLNQVMKTLEEIQDFVQRG
jgi:hypothetical protein